jgi:hypothetical protein
MGKKMQRRTTAGLGVVAGAGAGLLFSLGSAPLAGAQPDDTALTDVLGAQTDQFTAFSTNITNNLGTSVAGDNAIFQDYLTALPTVGNTAALNGLDEVSGQLNDQLANTNTNDLTGFNDVLSADHSDTFGDPGFPAVPAGSLGDVLDANTDNFTAFSNNLTANLGVSAGADSGIFQTYLTALPTVGNTAALNGLDEVSGQINDQLANTNANDVSALVDVQNAVNAAAGIPGGAGTGGASEADILAVLQNATDPNVTGALFGGVNGQLSGVADALASSSSTDVLGDDVTGAEVSNVFQDAGITIAPSSLTQADGIAALLNDAAPVAGGGGPAFADLLGAQTDQFTALSNNLTDNLNAAGLGDIGIFQSYLTALPDVGNTAALNGLDEVSGQINDQLANSNAIDVNGFDDLLGQDFTNLGDFLGI